MIYRIRTAVPSDEKRIRELFIEMLRTIDPSKDHDGYPEGYLNRFLTGGEDRIYLAEDENVEAYLSAEVHHEKEDYLYLDDFSVTEKYRSRGIGSALISAAEAYAGEIGIHDVFLHADKTNVSAIRFYDKRGYRIYRDEGHRYLMRKELE